MEFNTPSGIFKTKTKTSLFRRHMYMSGEAKDGNDTHCISEFKVEDKCEGKRKGLKLK